MNASMGMTDCWVCNVNVLKYNSSSAMRAYTAALEAIQIINETYAVD